MTIFRTALTALAVALALLALSTAALAADNEPPQPDAPGTLCNPGPDPVPNLPPCRTPRPDAPPPPRPPQPSATAEGSVNLVLGRILIEAAFLEALTQASVDGTHRIEVAGDSDTWYVWSWDASGQPTECAAACVQRPRMEASNRWYAVMRTTPTFKLVQWKRCAYRDSVGRCQTGTTGTIKVSVPMNLVVYCVGWETGRGAISVAIIQHQARFTRSTSWLEDVWDTLVDRGFTERINAGIQAQLNELIGLGGAAANVLASHPTCSSLGVRLGETVLDDQIVYDVPFKTR